MIRPLPPLRVSVPPLITLFSWHHLITLFSYQIAHYYISFIAFAPQSYRPHAKGYEFLQILDIKSFNIPAADYIVIQKDFNGQLGQRANGNRCHLRKGFGRHNKDGKHIIEFAETCENKKSQMNYILIRRGHCTGCEAVPNMATAPRHPTLIAALWMKIQIKQRSDDKKGNNLSHLRDGRSLWMPKKR